MAVSSEFIEAVENKDYRRIKLMMKNSITYDPSCSIFDEMMLIIEEKVPEIIENHDGEALKEKSEWTKSYYNEQIVRVMNNFSRERIQLLKEMSGALFTDVNNESKRDDAQTVDKVTQANHDVLPANNKMFLIILLVSVGALIALVGIIKHIVIILVLGIVVILFGIASLIFTLNKK